MVLGSFRFLTMALVVIAASLLFVKPTVGQSNTTLTNQTSTTPKPASSVPTEGSANATTPTPQLPTNITADGSNATTPQLPANMTNLELFSNLKDELQGVKGLSVGTKDAAEKAVSLATAILVFEIFGFLLIILDIVYTHFFVIKRR